MPRRMALPSGIYAPRDPAASALYQVVRDHYETLRVEAARFPDGERLPRFVEEEFEGFLRCGWHAGGFARFRVYPVPAGASGGVFVQGTRLLSELWRAPHDRTGRAPGGSRRAGCSLEAVGVHPATPACGMLLAWRHDLCKAVAGALYRAVQGHLRSWALTRGWGRPAAARSSSCSGLAERSASTSTCTHSSWTACWRAIRTARPGSTGRRRHGGRRSGRPGGDCADLHPFCRGTVSTRTTGRAERRFRGGGRHCWRDWRPVCSPGASRWQPSINRRVARSASTPASRCGTNRSALNMLTGVKLRRCSRPQPDGDRTRMNPHKHEVETGVTMHRRQRRWWFALAVMALLTCGGAGLRRRRTSTSLAKCPGRSGSST